MALGGSNQKDLGRYFAMGQVGLEMVAPIVLGIYLDERFGWGPWGVTVGAVLGLGGGIFHLVWLSNAANKADDAARAEREPK